MKKIHPNYFMFFILVLFVLAGSLFTIVAFVTTTEAASMAIQNPDLLGWIELTAPFQCFAALYIANGSLQLILHYFCLITFRENKIEIHYPFLFKTISIPTEAMREYNHSTLPIFVEKGFKTLLIRTRSNKWYEFIHLFHFNLSTLEQLLSENKAEPNPQLKGKGLFKRTYSAGK